MLFVYLLVYFLRPGLTASPGLGLNLLIQTCALLSQVAGTTAVLGPHPHCFALGCLAKASPKFISEAKKVKSIQLLMGTPKGLDKESLQW